MSEDKKTETPEAVEHPAVLVVRVPGENPGDATVQLFELNGIDPLAVPSLLKVAAKTKAAQLGIVE